MRPIVINQHYIPRSYLKNFGFLVNPKRRKWSLYAMENGGEIERRTTENICAIDYLYDLPLVTGEGRQFIEHAYEEHADRHFTEITEFATNDSALALSSEMREKILKSCLSLYFRTPKFVNLDQKALDEIQQFSENQREFAWNRKKQELLEQSVLNFEQLYSATKNCGISVNKAVREWEFISGDNPVIIRDRKDNFRDVFGMDNIIHIPLTPRYAISILPANDKTLCNSFNRVLYDDDSVMSINHDIEKYHQRYLLGSKQALESYVKEVPEYKAPAHPNHPKILNINELAVVTSELLSMVEKYGFFSQEVMEYFDFCWKTIPAFRNDPNAQQIKRQIS